MKIMEYCRIFALSILLPAGILYGGYAGYEKAKSLKKEPKRGQQKKLLTVQVEEVKPRKIRIAVSGYGKAKPIRSTQVKSQVTGKVTSVSAKLNIGHFVAKGELLAEIDPTDYKIEIQKILAEVAKWKAQQLTLEQEEKNLQKQIKLLTENVKLARRQIIRTEKLSGDGVASEQIRDQDRREYLTQSNRLLELENSLRLIPFRLEENKASLMAAEENLRQARTDFERTQILAPFAGRISEDFVEEGMLVSLGSLIATIDDVSSLEIPVMVAGEDFYKIGLRAQQIREKELSDIHAEVSLKIGRENYTWAGQISRIEPLNDSNRSVPVIIRVDNPWSETSKKPILMSGSFCEVKIQGAFIEGVVAIPQTAIHENDEVFLAVDSKLKIVHAAIEHRMGSLAIISKGVKLGDQVILSQITYPVNGMRLNIEDQDLLNKEVTALNNSK